MIKALLAIAANRIIIDAMSNRLSIVDVYEGLKSQSFPIVVPGVTFLFYLRRDAGDPPTKNLSLKCSIDDTETLKIPVSVDFQQGSTTRSIISFEGFVIPKAGAMKVALLDGELVLGELELPVEKLEVAQPQVKANPPPPAGA